MPVEHGRVDRVMKQKTPAGTVLPDLFSSE